MKYKDQDLLVGMQIGTTAVGNNLVVPQKAKHRIPCDTKIPLLGIYLKELKKKKILKQVLVQKCSQQHH